MKNADLVNALTNTLGNPHFDPDKVQEQLKEQFADLRGGFFILQHIDFLYFIFSPENIFKIDGS